MACGHGTLLSDRQAHKDIAIQCSTIAGESISRTAMLFLCGDVMTGRGIDQILPRPGKPTLFESCVRSATTYAELAKRATGPVPRSIDFDYL